MKYHPPPKKTNKTEQRKGRGSEAEREKAQATVYTLGHVHVQSSQYLFKLLLLLLPLCKPPLNFFFQFCVWPDLVHGKGTTIKRICLVTE